MTSRIRLLSSLLIFDALLSSCCKPCNDADKNLFMEVEKENLTVIKEYLENGGDALFTCAVWRAGGRSYHPVCRSLDEFVKHSL